MTYEAAVRDLGSVEMTTRGWLSGNMADYPVRFYREVIT